MFDLIPQLLGIEKAIDNASATTLPPANGAAGIKITRICTALALLFKITGEAGGTSVSFLVWGKRKNDNVWEFVSNGVLANFSTGSQWLVLQDFWKYNRLCVQITSYTGPGTVDVWSFPALPHILLGEITSLLSLVLASVNPSSLMNGPHELNALAVTDDPWDDFIDVGDPIDCTGALGVSIFGKFTKGDASNPLEFRWLLLYDVGGTVQPVEPKYAADFETQSERTHIITLPVADDVDFYIEMPTSNRIKYLQLQARCLNAQTAQIESSAQYILGR